MLLTFDISHLNREITKLRQFVVDVQQAGSGITVRAPDSVTTYGVIPDDLWDDFVQMQDLSDEDLRRVDQALDSALARLLRP